jgi:sulfide:quinone oxidoreductase
LHVLVAGGGPAAAETVFALREHAGPRVRLTLVAPNFDLAPRAARGAEPFSPVGGRGRPLRALARQVRAHHYAGRVTAVDAARHEVALADHGRLGYDALVLAVGGRPRIAYPTALTFFGQAGAVALNRVMDDIESGRTRSLAFVVPPGAGWAVPLYELAIQVGIEVRAAGLDVRLRLITPERGPLAIFGARGEASVRALLDEAGVAFRGCTTVVCDVHGRLLEDDDQALPEQRVVALPALDGPALSGTPQAAGGFLPVDHHGAVRGAFDVFAAGAATTYPLKQADLACQQASTVAEALAQRAGAYVTPSPWKPVVRAHLLAGRGRSLVLEHHGVGRPLPAATCGCPR